jgi:hypothetical protein
MLWRAEVSLKDSSKEVKNRSDETVKESAAEVKRRFSDEHKALQDKMDKIGSFRFTIKGWSITAVGATSAIATAAASAASLRTVFMISSGIAVMMFFFFYFEYQQVRLSRTFGFRAKRLEDILARFDRNVGKSMSFPSPYVAHEIAFAAERRKLLRWRARTWIERGRVAIKADVCFYIVLILLAFLIPLMPRREEVKEWWKQFRGEQIQTPPPLLLSDPNNPALPQK